MPTWCLKTAPSPVLTQASMYCDLTTPTVSCIPRGSVSQWRFCCLTANCSLRGTGIDRLGQIWNSAQMTNSIIDMTKNTDSLLLFHKGGLCTVATQQLPTKT
uniref:Uncharacterized protein n=1 Tax=Anguilla anguilla TaxID=7936 RepID=A0A0E9X2Y8_ANGAN